MDYILIRNLLNKRKESKKKKKVLVTGGTGYIGSMKIVGLVITDKDYVGGLNEEAFKGYLSSSAIIGPDIIEWERTESKEENKE